MKSALGFFGLALAVALVAACSDDLLDGQPRGTGSGTGSGDGNGDGSGSGNGTGKSSAAGTGSGTGAGDDGPTPTDTSKAPDTAAKAYFVANVHPTLISTCGGCHQTGPGPAWLSPDAEISYKMMFQLGYVSLQSRILLKGPHQTTQGLNADQSQKFTTWVQMETASGATAGTASTLSKIGACFDRTKFDAMGLGKLRTTQRTNDNNVNKVAPWNENANNCTGCNQTACRNCHSGDDATLFVNAEGNPNLSSSFTFDHSKETNPAYVTKYFGVSPTGEPIASNAIKIKSEATSKDKAYTHPYFIVSEQQQAKIDDFVNSAIAKYKATGGNCQ